MLKVQMYNQNLVGTTYLERRYICRQVFIRIWAWQLWKLTRTKSAPSSAISIHGTGTKQIYFT